MLWITFIISLLALCVNYMLCSDGFGSKLVTSMKDDANLDLSMDEEYEDLRAELLAYHSALASLASGKNEGSRRSMKQTSCWKEGGICINHLQCAGEEFVAEVPGCKNKHEVCCLKWNQFRVRYGDFKELGYPNAYYPWKSSNNAMGQSVVDIHRNDKRSKFIPKNIHIVRLVSSDNKNNLPVAQIVGSDDGLHVHNRGHFRQHAMSNFENKHYDHKVPNIGDQSVENIGNTESAVALVLKKLFHE